MHSRLKWPAVVSCLLFFVSSAAAQFGGPVRAPSPTPLPSRPPAVPSPSPTSTDEILPVVITYGEGVETRAQITNGVMEPVGIPPDQPVTVTLYLASGVPGSPVQVGLFDGGQISPAVSSQTVTQSVSLPNPTPLGSITVVDASAILVLADGTVRFNFQSGRTLGLYRTLVTVGPKEYLLQLYATRPRPTPALPLPNPPPVQ